MAMAPVGLFAWFSENVLLGQHTEKSLVAQGNESERRLTN